MKKEEYTSKNSGPLAYLGSDLIDNGYEIIPIAVGKKAPGFDNWSKARSTKQQLQEWVESGHRNSGVGVLTKLTPAVDIDVRDEKVALDCEKKAREIFGSAPLRIGMPPKRLLLYRTDKPFRKMRSNRYQDEWGELHQIEILCDGQQCVVYHTHPDTGKPYAWPDEKFEIEVDKDGKKTGRVGDVIEAGGPLTIPASELTPITVEKCQEFINWFHERAKQESDWKIVKSQRDNGLANIDYDDPFIEDTQAVNITEQELRSRLMMVPNPDDYETWVQVGMALYHQFDGDETGLNLWNEWSETADNYDRDALERRWDDFGIEGKKRAPITARFILRLSKEAAAESAAELMVTLKDKFSDAKTLIEWNKARDAAREAEIDGLARAALASLAKDRIDIITGTKTPLSEVKKAIAYSPSKGEKMPGWCEGWVYDTSDDRFYDTKRNISTTKQGFDAMFDRYALTKKDILDGKSSPSSSASALALNLYKIKVVNGRRYEPGKDPVFYAADGVYANTYPEHEIPKLPDELLPRDKAAIRRVKNHIRHLLVKQEERRILLDWLSWVVQNPGRHVNWSILLQGVEGDGKSFFAFLMRAVMGVSNVQMLNAHILESSFTDWLVGQCLTCIEEVRLINAHNKYELLNRIKPNITNDIIEVHPKGKSTYNATNTTSYLLFSNYRDALPLDDDGRRYCVLFSQWQRKDKLDAFKDENPDYYEDLYASIQTSAPALRKWLLEWEQSDSFKPFGDAPTTDAKKYMIRQAQPEFIQNLTDIITEEVDPLISYDLIDGVRLTEVLMDRGLDVPGNKAVGSMMSRHRFECIGKVRVGTDYRTYYTRNVEMFQTSDGDGGAVVIDNAKVRKFVLDARAGTDDDDEL
jgi:hypothetical protein